MKREVISLYGKQYMQILPSEMQEGDVIYAINQMFKCFISPYTQERYLENEYGSIGLGENLEDKDIVFYSVDEYAFIHWTDQQGPCCY